MNIFKSKRHTILIKSVTFILTTTFLCQNIAFAAPQKTTVQHNKLQVNSAFDEESTNNEWQEEFKRECQKRKEGKEAKNKKIIKKSIKRILLINAGINGKGIDVRPPLNVWYLYSYLKKEFGDRIEVKILDIAVQKEDFQIESFISTENPDFIGISTPSTFCAHIASELAMKIKSRFPDKIIAAGGVHPSSIPEEVVKTTPVDFVAQGDGEITLCKTIKVISFGDGDISKVPGLWYKTDAGSIVHTGTGLYPEMDELPILNPEGLNIDDYDMSSAYFNNEKAWTLMTHRGCPMGCPFCAVGKISGKKYRCMSAERVLEEIKYIVKKYKITNLNIIDDAFTLDQKRTRKIAELILKDKELPRIRWKITTGADTVTEDLLEIMARAGLEHISFGVETGDPELLRKIKNHAKLDNYKRAAEWAKKYGIKVRYLLMVGLPYQDSGSVNKTIEFLRETKPDEVFVHIYTPFPGTEYTEHPEQYGIIIPEEIDYARYLKRDYGPLKPMVNAETKWMSKEQILEARNRIIRAHQEMISESKKADERGRREADAAETEEGYSAVLSQEENKCDPFSNFSTPFKTCKKKFIFNRSMSQFNYREVVELVLREIKKVMLKNEYDIRRSKNILEDVRKVLIDMLENLRQHEYSEENLVMRVYLARNPYEGIRIEFWGPGKEKLPDLLKRKPWFSHVDRPWQTEEAPKGARSKETMFGVRLGRYLFPLLRSIEERWQLPPDKHILIGWREDEHNEGPRQNGHIIALHIPMMRVEKGSDSISTGSIDLDALKFADQLFESLSEVLKNEGADIVLSGLSNDLSQITALRDVDTTETEPSPLPESAERKALIESLKAETDKDKRLATAGKLGLDIRPIESGLLSAEFVGHDMSVKQIVNPDNKDDLVAVYGAAGADISNFLLATNAATAYFVDTTPVKIDKLRYSLENEWDRLDQVIELALGVTGRPKSYTDFKYRNGYASSYVSEMPDIERCILLELKYMGVEKGTIKFLEDSQDGTVTISFEWSYIGQREKKKYQIAYIKTDISKPNSYPKILDEVLKKGIDIYYQRAAYNLPRDYNSYILDIADNINKDGYLITDDDSYDGGYYYLDGILKSSETADYTSKDKMRSDEMKEWETAIRFSNYLPKSLSTSNYGWLVSIRQKKAKESPDHGQGESAANAEEVIEPPPCVKKLLGKAVDTMPGAGGIGGIENFMEISKLNNFKYLFTEDLGKEDFPQGYPLSIREPEKRKYPEGYINVNLPNTNTFLVSRSGKGNYGTVRFGWLTDGTPVAIKGLYAKEDCNKQILNEYKRACLADELGIVPRIHGLYLDKEFGRINIVMDIVSGDHRSVTGNFINLDTVRDLIEIYKRLTDNELSIRSDFQYFISKEGRVLIIDMENIIQESEERSMQAIDILGRFLANVSDDIRARSLEMIVEEEPDLIGAIKERARTSPYYDMYYASLIDSIDEVEKRLKKEAEKGPDPISAFNDEQANYNRLNLDIKNAFEFLGRDYTCPLKTEVFERLLDLVINPSNLEDPKDVQKEDAARVLSENKSKIAAREELLKQLKNPSYDWFLSYITALNDYDKTLRTTKDILKAMSGLTPAEREGQYYGGILNVSKGCSIQCHWCYTNPGPVRYFPWPWIEEIASLFKQYGLKGPAIHYFDGDPLRDYYDPLYHKNYADVAALLTPQLITTAGFDIDSEGEKAARRIKAEHPEIDIRVTITLESAWAKRIGKEMYIKTMKNVISILKPNEIILRYSEVNESGKPTEAMEVFKEIVGREPRPEEGAFVSEEGRAARLKGKRVIPKSDKSVQCVFGPVLNPDGTIEIIMPEGNTYRSTSFLEPLFKKYQQRQWSMAEERLASFQPEVILPAIKGQDHNNKDIVGNEEFIKRLMTILKNILENVQFGESRDALRALFNEEFAGRVIFYSGPTIHGSFADPSDKKVSFEIAIPVLQRKFSISYNPSDSQPMVEAFGEQIPLNDFLPRLREMISNSEYLEISERAKKDLILRLKTAICAKDNAEILKVLKLLLDDPSEEYLTGIIDVFQPTYNAKWGKYSLTASDNIYLRVIYVISLMMPTFGYALGQEKYSKILKAMKRSKGIDTIEFNGSFYVGQYVFKNEIAIKTSDENRRVVSEHFIFRKPEGEKEEYTFTINELAESLNISAKDIEKIIEGLNNEGRVVKNEDGSYTTDLLNILCATDLYQTVINDKLSKKYESAEELDRALYKLQYLPDLKVLDYAYQNMLIPNASDVIRRTVSNIRNREMLAEVVKKHYEKIKSLIMGQLWKNQSVPFLIVSLGMARYMDDELAKFLFNTYLKADKGHWITRDIEYALKECGKLIDGPDALECAIDRLLSIDNINTIFSPDIIDKIRKIPELLKELEGVNITSKDFNTTEELAIALFNAHLSLGKPEITDLLKLFLSGLVEIAKGKYEIYTKMGGALYRTVTWERFQVFYGLLKTLRAKMLKEVKEKAQIAGLLAPITGLMEQTGDPDTASELPKTVSLVHAKSFADQYRETLDTDSLIALLLQHYPMDSVKLDVKAVPAMFGSTHAKIKKAGPKHYQIDLFNAHGNSLQYLLFHEFMHAYLWEKGLLFAWDDSDPQIGKYLFNLLNMVEDYLIEKENHRIFGSAYSYITQELRDTDLTGIIDGAGTADNVDILMLALTCKLTTTFYPELANSISAKLVGEGIKFGRLDEVLSILGTLSIESSFEDYKDAVLRIHLLLTNSEAVFNEKTISVDSESIKKFCRYIDELMSPVISAVRTKNRLPEGSPANFFRILTWPENISNKMPIEELSKQSGISADTIERDMRILRKAGLVIRENMAGKITFKVNPDLAKSPEKIKTAHDILDEEYKEGQIARRSKNKIERERIVLRLIASVNKGMEFHQADSSKNYFEKLRGLDLDCEVKINDALFDRQRISWWGLRCVDTGLARKCVEETFGYLQIKDESEADSAISAINNMIREIRCPVSSKEGCADDNLIKALPEIARSLPEIDIFLDALYIEKQLFMALLNDSMGYKYSWECLDTDQGYHNGDAIEKVKAISKSVYSIYKNLFSNQEELKSFVKNLAKALSEDTSLKSRLNNEAALYSYLSLLAKGKTSPSSKIKCVVVDADGVLWKGILGEDGESGIQLTEAHIAFQRELLALKERGFLLAINSKNNPGEIEGSVISGSDGILEKHPDMALRRNDFAVIKANWQDKAANLKEIAAELNIGLDSLLFLDDSKHERELARTICPEVSTPDLPDNPERRVEFLRALPELQKERITDEDRRRTELYELQRKRGELRKESSTIEDFYRSLQMRITIREGRDNQRYITRIAQLTQRTNQFNVTEKRYTEADIKSFLNDSDYKVFTLELADKFGRDGIVGLIILHRDNNSGDKWTIDAFCLSCRAIGRTVEIAFIACVIKRIREEGAKILEGIYQTINRRNRLVEDLYTRLGFSPTCDFWTEVMHEKRWEAETGKINIPIPEWIITEPDTESQRQGSSKGGKTVLQHGIYSFEDLSSAMAVITSAGPYWRRMMDAVERLREERIQAGATGVFGEAFAIKLDGDRTYSLRCSFPDRRTELSDGIVLQTGDSVFALLHELTHSLPITELHPELQQIPYHELKFEDYESLSFEEIYFRLLQSAYEEEAISTLSEALFYRDLIGAGHKKEDIATKEERKFMENVLKVYEEEGIIGYLRSELYIGRNHRLNYNLNRIIQIAFLASINPKMLKDANLSSLLSEAGVQVSDSGTKAIKDRLDEIRNLLENPTAEKIINFVMNLRAQGVEVKVDVQRLVELAKEKYELVTGRRQKASPSFIGRRKETINRVRILSDAHIYVDRYRKDFEKAWMDAKGETKKVEWEDMSGLIEFYRMLTILEYYGEEIGSDKLRALSERVEAVITSEPAEKTLVNIGVVLELERARISGDRKAIEEALNRLFEINNFYFSVGEDIDFDNLSIGPDYGLRLLSELLLDPKVRRYISKQEFKKFVNNLISEAQSPSGMAYREADAAKKIDDLLFFMLVLQRLAGPESFEEYLPNEIFLYYEVPLLQYIIAESRGGNTKHAKAKENIETKYIPTLNYQYLLESIQSRKLKVFDRDWFDSKIGEAEKFHFDANISLPIPILYRIQGLYFPEEVTLYPSRRHPSFPSAIMSKEQSNLMSLHLMLTFLELYKDKKLPEINLGEVENEINLCLRVLDTGPAMVRVDLYSNSTPPKPLVQINNFQNRGKVEDIWILCRLAGRLAVCAAGLGEVSRAHRMIQNIIDHYENISNEADPSVSTILLKSRHYLDITLQLLPIYSAPSIEEQKTALKNFTELYRNTVKLRRIGIEPAMLLDQLTDFQNEPKLLPNLKELCEIAIEHISYYSFHRSEFRKGAEVIFRFIRQSPWDYQIKEQLLEMLFNRIAPRPQDLMGSKTLSQQQWSNLFTWFESQLLSDDTLSWVGLYPKAEEILLRRSGELLDELGKMRLPRDMMGRIVQIARRLYNYTLTIQPEILDTAMLDRLANLSDDKDYQIALAEIYPSRRVEINMDMPVNEWSPAAVRRGLSNPETAWHKIKTALEDELSGSISGENALRIIAVYEAFVLERLESSGKKTPILSEVENLFKAYHNRNKNEGGSEARKAVQTALGLYVNVRRILSRSEVVEFEQIKNIEAVGWLLNHIDKALNDNRDLSEKELQMVTALLSHPTIADSGRKRELYLVIIDNPALSIELRREAAIGLSQSMPAERDVFLGLIHLYKKQGDKNKEAQFYSLIAGYWARTGRIPSVYNLLLLNDEVGRAEVFWNEFDTAMQWKKGDPVTSEFIELRALREGHLAERFLDDAKKYLTVEHPERLTIVYKYLIEEIFPMKELKKHRAEWLKMVNRTIMKRESRKESLELLQMNLPPVFVNQLPEIRFLILSYFRNMPEQYKAALITELQNASAEITGAELFLLFFTRVGLEKAGQFLSTMVGTVPEKDRAVFASLQDRVPASSPLDVKRTVERELKKPLSEIFSEWDDTPIASASMGEVYSARLLNGKKVYVKVKPRTKRDQIVNAIATLRKVADDYEKNQGRFESPIDIADRLRYFAKQLEIQLDFRKELRQAEDFLGRNYNTPHYYEELTTADVMVMDPVIGTKITEINNPEEKSKAAQAYAEEALEMLLVDGKYHADPHPGNVFWNSESGQIIWLDWGIVSSLNSRERDKLMLFLHAVHQKDLDALLPSLIDLAIPQASYNKAQLRAELKRVQKEGLKDEAEYLISTLNAAGRAGLFLKSDIVQAISYLITIKGVVQDLDPDFDFSTLLAKKFMEALDPEHPRRIMEPVTESSV